MTGRENADAKWSENKIEEEEDSVKKVNCLRGRLLAERVASRNARDEAEQLGNKLLELENLLKEEAKSRNRAEKKLKLLVKRLESMNISYATDESEHDSGLLHKNDIFAQSSSSSSSTKEPEKVVNLLVNVSTMSESQESMEGFKSPKGSSNSLVSLSHDSSTTERSSTSGFEVNLPELKDQESETGSFESPTSSTVLENSDQNVQENDTVEDSLTEKPELTDEQRVESSTGEGLNQEDDQDQNNHIDNSMALVAVDTPQENRTVDPEVLDETVKEVLDALRRAKEQLQNSMERRRMSMIIKVG